jgi:hypothetical protein
VIAYACGVCDRPAPPLDSLEILEWQGGELAYNLGERDPLILNLHCPEHREDEEQ